MLIPPGKSDVHEYSAHSRDDGVSRRDHGSREGCASISSLVCSSELKDAADRDVIDQAPCLADNRAVSRHAVVERLTAQRGVQFLEQVVGLIKDVLAFRTVEVMSKVGEAASARSESERCVDPGQESLGLFVALSRRHRKIWRQQTLTAEFVAGHRPDVRKNGCECRIESMRCL